MRENTVLLSQKHVIKLLDSEIVNNKISQYD